MASAAPLPPDPREALHRRLARFTGGAQRLANELYGPRSLTTFAALGRELTWQWRHREAREPVERVRLGAPQGEAWLAIERDHGFGADAAVDWRDLSDDARLLAWTLSYEPLVGQLRALLGLALEPIAILPAADAALGPALCALQFDVLDASARPVLCGTVSLRPELIGADLTIPGAAAQGAVRLESLPIPFQVVVTALEIPAASLRALTSGDILALGTQEKIRAGAHMTFESKDRALRIAVRLGAAAARVEALAAHPPRRSPFIQGSKQRVAMSSSDEPASLAAQVDALPVTLSFEAGEISLTVAELKALAPGAMLSFGRKLTDAPITLRANGRVLGVGELVLIDDFLGVRLLELRDHGAQ